MLLPRRFMKFLVQDSKEDYVRLSVIKAIPEEQMILILILHNYIKLSFACMQLYV